ncbi:hypothetical protein L484_024653 [Morus notabilis]|uniref:Uncharacterized protein n=1 Tax=Morus notabilis TaxID=981085 RepID=W9R252_9ROSA|nr:hypothetical protein L484_024653 [Morus notabilis]
MCDFARSVADLGELRADLGKLRVSRSGAKSARSEANGSKFVMESYVDGVGLHDFGSFEADSGRAWIDCRDSDAIGPDSSVIWVVSGVVRVKSRNSIMARADPSKVRAGSRNYGGPKSGICDIDAIETDSGGIWFGLTFNKIRANFSRSWTGFLDPGVA